MPLSPYRCCNCTAAIQLYRCTAGTTDQTEFWSSRGSEGQAGEEGLLYDLESAACAVKYVRIAVYRAQYQHG